MYILYSHLHFLGELTTFYDEKSRTAAVNFLMKYVQKEQDKIYSKPDSFQNTTIRRHELIKSMIHEFCRTFVGVEFIEKAPTSPDNTKFRPNIGFPSFGKEPNK